MSEFKELRARAKELGINTFQMSKSMISEKIAEAEANGAQPATPKKKGGASWKWRNRFEVDGKDPNFRYRFVSREESNLRDKLADGWQFVNSATGIPGEHLDPRQVADGVPLDGAQTYRDMILMALPEELAQQRDKAVKELTRQQTVNLKSRLQSDLKNPDGQTAEVHGNITIIE